MVLQDAAVAVFAAAGVAVLVRRFVRAMRPSSSGAACPSCAAGAAACAKPSVPAPPPLPTSHDPQ